MEFERSHLTISKKLIVSLACPMKLLVTRPIIYVIDLQFAYNFVVYCIALSTFVTVFVDKHYESTSTSGLNYISIALGFTIASQASGHITDRTYAHPKVKAGDSLSHQNIDLHSRSQSR